MLTQTKILWVLPLWFLSTTDGQQIILRNIKTLIRSFCEKKNYFSKLTASFMWLHRLQEDGSVKDHAVLN